jgi:cystathionine gamma-lyase
VDASDAAAVAAAITPLTKMIWVETPGNPLRRIADLAAIARISRERGILTVADNTFASPVVQRPLEFGFDIVVHSVTKYVSGLSDIIGGAAIVRDGRELIEKLRFLQNATGDVLDPFGSFLALRGLRTLPLRMERHAANALEVARFLEQHPKVARVQYSGLPSHPQHNLAARQMASGGGMVSFFVKGSPEATVNSRTDPVFHTRGVAWRRREPGRPSVDDEPFIGSRAVAAGGRNYSSTRPTFRRHRGRLGLDPRSRSCARGRVND